MIEKEKIYNYLSLASKMLLIAFFLSIAVVGVIYYTHIDQMNYEVLPQGENKMFYVQTTNYTLISYNDYLMKKHQFNNWFLITITCLIGFMIVNDKFKKNIKQAWKEWVKYFEKIN